MTWGVPASAFGAVTLGLTGAAGAIDALGAIVPGAAMPLGAGATGAAFGLGAVGARGRRGGKSVNRRQEDNHCSGGNEDIA
jgi:hypothetical protein